MSTHAAPVFDTAAAVAAVVRARPRPILVGLDVDGVLAPIVDHADDARLLAGVEDAIDAVSRLADVHVAVVSGRSIGDLERFDFPHGITVVGSHGMESRGESMIPLDVDELHRLERLRLLADIACSDAGDGAWVEQKPASVVVHVRLADTDRGRLALSDLAAGVAHVRGASVKAGSGVLELFARDASKGSAIVALAEQLGAATTVFVGDDVTDEDAFAALGADDVTIKVGDAPTIATLRLADPPAVLAWLRLLAAPD